MEPISSLQTSSDPADVCYLAVLWQAETMWMHTADNDCIVCLFHAAREPLWRAVIQSQSRDLCFSLESMPVSMGLGQNIDKVISLFALEMQLSGENVDLLIKRAAAALNSFP